jgi:hypothetical protein
MWKKTYVGDGNGVVLADGLITDIVEHVLDEHGALGDDAIYVYLLVWVQR